MEEEAYVLPGEEDVQKKFGERYKRYGNNAFLKGDLEIALANYTKAIKCAPNNAVYYSNRAACYLKMRLYNEAKQDAKECITLDPSFIKGYSRLATSLFQLGKFKKAMIIANEGINREKTIQNKTEDATLRNILKLSDEYIKEAGNIQVDFVLELPLEVLDVIARFLDATSLIKCESVCTKLRNVVLQEHLWKNLCRVRWVGKQQSPYTTVFKQNEISRNKHWKMYYWDAEKDAKRTQITEEELVNTKWDFNSTFSHGVEVFPKFHSNHTYSSLMTQPGLKWRLLDGGKKVQVHEFPPLVVSRTANWGWQLLNAHVIFLSNVPLVEPPSENNTI
jgi:tetratricopeptide (TPR) repeat protein